MLSCWGTGFICQVYAPWFFSSPWTRQLPSLRSKFRLVRHFKTIWLRVAKFRRPIASATNGRADTWWNKINQCKMGNAGALRGSRIISKRPQASIAPVDFAPLVPNFWRNEGYFGRTLFIKINCAHTSTFQLSQNILDLPHHSAAFWKSTTFEFLTPTTPFSTSVAENVS